MTWRISSPLAGCQPIANTETTQKHPLGTIVQAYDPTHGWGEFIYCEGVANTDDGDVVTYHAATFQTAIGSVTGATPASFAVAMSDNVADQYGWYQISGRATVRKATATSFAAGAAVGITSGLAVAAVTAKRLSGAVAGVASAAQNTIVLFIDRPRSSTVAET